MRIRWKGKCSWFGGPNDTGVSPSEGLAFIYELDDAPHLFLPEQPPGTTGLARRLNPDKYYIACRWDYDVTSKEDLPGMKIIVRAPSTGREFIAEPADWGPHEDTERVADLSPALLDDLGIETDDEVEIEFEAKPSLPTFVISSGHGLKVRGASGYIDEVDEARRVVSKVVSYLKRLGCTVHEFHDNHSTTQERNLEAIVDFHNSFERDLDVSVHFNAYETTEDPMGTECLYVTEGDLSARVSAAISNAGDLLDRGKKHRTNLYFLNNTSAPAILIEVCFVDSDWDTTAYQANFDAICVTIAETIMTV